MLFFNIDLHISIIADMKDIFSKLGHSIKDMSLSDHTWVFNRSKDSVPMLDNDRWRNLSPEQFSDEFYQNYKDELANFDGFIVTYPPPFALLYKYFDKPIIINNPIRYEWPFSFRPNAWNKFNTFIREGVDNKKIILVANNLYDKYYMENFIQRETIFIPSICDYYKKYYTTSESKSKFIYYSRDKIAEINNQNIVYKNDIFKQHTHHDLLHFKGIIHIPYQISYMSIFEQYTSNIPLFFPTKEFLLKLYQEKRYSVLKEMSWNNLYNAPDHSMISYDGKFDPNAYNNIDSVTFWLNYADFYDDSWMPYITYFDSFDELNEIVNTVDTDYISNMMREFNTNRQNKIHNMWKDVLNNI
jgi:hypothetical protein